MEVSDIKRLTWEITDHAGTREMACTMDISGTHLYVRINSIFHVNIKYHTSDNTSRVSSVGLFLSYLNGELTNIARCAHERILS